MKQNRKDGPPKRFQRIEDRPPATNAMLSERVLDALLSMPSKGYCNNDKVSRDSIYGYTFRHEKQKESYYHSGGPCPRCPKFQHQLARLANTIALKVEREGVKVTQPHFTAADITVMLRQSLSIYELLCFVNADDIRKSPGWKAAYVAALLPLNRSLIDCLYNITALLRFPSKRFAFRESGYKLALKGLRDDEKRYRGKRKWKEYVTKQIDLLRIGMRADNITMQEVEAAKRWPTLGKYLRVEKGAAPTPHQEFLRKLTYVFWQEYSAMTHAVFQGLMPTAVFYLPDLIPHELREQFDTVVVERMIATHLARNAGVLLCTLTEIQAHYRFFDEARINKRLHDVWSVLVQVPEVRELYDLRYAKLMKEKGIVPD